jgi:hypothetical protein
MLVVAVDMAEIHEEQVAQVEQVMLEQVLLVIWGKMQLQILVAVEVVLED